MNARCQELFDATSLPFWAFCWGSGQALARYLLDRPSEVAGKRVVDFGAGSGVVAIAAAMAGAHCVTAVDIDPMARRFSVENAKLNGVTIAVSPSAPEAWDVLIASDVLYDDANYQRICAIASGDTTAAAGEYTGQTIGEDRTVIVADPQRDGAVRLEKEPLARVEARTFPDVDYPLQSTVIYRFAGPDLSHVR